MKSVRLQLRLLVATCLALTLTTIPAIPPTIPSAPAAQPPVSPSQNHEPNPGSRPQPTVLELVAHRKSGVTTARLSNNVVLQHRLVDHSQPSTSTPGTAPAASHEASITIAINGAELLETQHNRGISALAVALLNSDSRTTIPQPQIEPVESVVVASAREAHEPLARGLSAPADSPARTDTDADSPASPSPAASKSEAKIKVAAEPSVNAQVVRAASPVHVDAAVLQDAFLIRIRGDKQHLKAGLQWLVTVIEGIAEDRSPLNDDPAGIQERRAQLTQSLSLDRLAAGRALSGALVEALHKNPQARLQLPSVDALNRLDDRQARDWLREHARNAPIEAAIVGDVDLDDALELVLPTLGVLSSRPEPQARLMRCERVVEPAQGPIAARSTDSAMRTRCSVLVGFRGCDLAQMREHRLLRAAAAILSRRVDQAARDHGFELDQPISFSANPGLAYPSLGVVITSCQIEPERTDELIGLVNEMIDELSHVPPPLEELAGVIASLIEQAREFETDERAWSTILARAASRGINPDDLADGSGFYRSLKPADISDALARAASTDRRFSVVVCPPPALSAPSPAAAPVNQIQDLSTHQDPQTPASPDSKNP